MGDSIRSTVQNIRSTVQPGWHGARPAPNAATKSKQHHYYLGIPYLLVTTYLVMFSFLSASSLSYQAPHTSRSLVAGHGNHPRRKVGFRFGFSTGQKKMAKNGWNVVSPRAPRGPRGRFPRTPFCATSVGTYLTSCKTSESTSLRARRVMGLALSHTKYIGRAKAKTAVSSRVILC